MGSEHNKNNIDPNNPPVCLCGKKAIIAQAGILQNIPYWYCPDCKIEVKTAKELIEDLKGTSIFGQWEIFDDEL